MLGIQSAHGRNQRREMDFGLTLLTHGVMTRDDEGDCFLQNITPEEMAPVESAVRAEELGFHSVWFSDHVVTERVTGAGEHPANLSGKRAYPERPVLLDIPTTIGAIASRTTTLRFSPSVYIAPYRHPLITAHEFATLDVLSRGPRDPRRRRRLGEGRVRRDGRRVRAPRRDHRRVHPDLQAAPGPSRGSSSTASSSTSRTSRWTPSPCRSRTRRSGTAA